MSFGSLIIMIRMNSFCAKSGDFAQRGLLIYKIIYLIHHSSLIIHNPMGRESDCALFPPHHKPIVSGNVF